MNAYKNDLLSDLDPDPNVFGSNYNNVYTFTLPTSGRISLHFEGEMEWVRLYLESPSGSVLWEHAPHWDTDKQRISYDTEIDLNAGQYYFSVYTATGSKYTYTTGSKLGDYSFKLDFDQTVETFQEEMSGSNQSETDANLVDINGRRYKGFFAITDTVDYYKFTMPQTGYVDFSFTTNIETPEGGVLSHGPSIYLSEADGNREYTKMRPTQNNNGETTYNERWYLAKGSYYLRFVADKNTYNTGQTIRYTGEYDFSLSGTLYDSVSFEEDYVNPDSYDSANTIEFNETYVGYLAWNDAIDYYKFTVPKDGVYHVTSIDADATNWYQIYTSEQVQESDFYNSVWTHYDYSNSGQTTFEESVTLKAGEYYLKVSTGNAKEKYGVYCFKITDGPFLTGITIDKTLEVTTNNTKKISVTYQPSNAINKELTWTSSNDSVASVDGHGNVTGHKYGTATITASSLDGRYTATCQVNVKFSDAYIGNSGNGVTLTKNMVDSINWMADKGITMGYSDGTFGAFKSCDRVSFVIFLWRYAGKPAATGTVKNFPDVTYAKTSDSYKAIAWATSKGIISGYNDGTFRPTDSVTRAQVATMLWKYAGRPSAAATSKFPDVKNGQNGLTANMVRAINWCSTKKIVNGYSDGTFRPSADCLRSQMSVILYKYNNDK